MLTIFALMKTSERDTVSALACWFLSLYYNFNNFNSSAFSHFIKEDMHAYLNFQSEQKNCINYFHCTNWHCF